MLPPILRMGQLVHLEKKKKNEYEVMTSGKVANS